MADSQRASPRTWKSIWWLSLFRSENRWKLSLAPEHLEIERWNTVVRIPFAAIGEVAAARGRFSSELNFRYNGREMRLPCAPQRDADEIVETVVGRSNHHWSDRIEDALAKVGAIEDSLEAFLRRPGYLRRSHIAAFQKDTSTRIADVRKAVAAITGNLRASVLPRMDRLKQACLRIERALASSDEYERRNVAYIAAECEAMRTFFDGVEKTPLSDEQRVASVAFDDCNLLNAAAGSGKTSTLVGKVGYVLKRRIFPPEEIVAICFNRGSAKELRERFKKRFETLLPGKRVRACTFHSLGRSIIRAADRQNGRKRHLLGGKSESEHDDAALLRLRQITVELQEKAEFRADWLNFIALCRVPVPAEDAFDSWADYRDYIYQQRRKRSDGTPPTFRTLSGVETVKSVEELIIANWLWLNGVPYRYEERFDPKPPHWRSYHPDFFYPDINAWHEHFGLRKDGTAPCFFENPARYPRDAEEKRRWLERNASGRWFETQSWQYRSGELLDVLRENLARRGQLFTLRTEKEIEAQVRSLREWSPVDLIARALHMVRSNGYDRAHVARCLGAIGDPYRVAQFEKVFWPVLDRYAESLDRKAEIDFDDMIIQAAEMLESGKVKLAYRFVGVDEFQDLSPGRARFLKALLKQQSDSVLFGVGDDWQAINGFAGSDFRLFTEFQKHFGSGWEGNLSLTYRCPQSICDASSWFVSRNTEQKTKTVEARTDGGRDIELLAVAKDDDTCDCIRAVLSEALVGATRVRSVFILSRNVLSKSRGVDGGKLAKLKADFAGQYAIEFSTVHQSKGLEADFVFVIGANGGSFRAFPPMIVEDTVISALGVSEAFPHAEERRLFYVALTRAREKCWLLFCADQPSPFVLALVEGPMKEWLAFRGEPLPEVCPKCRKGLMIVAGAAVKKCSRRGVPFEKCFNEEVVDGRGDASK